MKVYLCSTPYHLYISLCNLITEKNDGYIILSTPDENIFKLFKQYKNNLDKLDIIKGVFIRKRDNFKERIFLEQIKDILEYKHLKKYIEQNTIYIFPWSPYGLYTPSEYLFKKSKNVILVEDGSSMYLKKKPSKLSGFVKKYLYFRDLNFYKKDKISKILVQYPQKYQMHLQTKLTKLDLNYYYGNMENSDKETLINIFNSNVNIDIFDKASIILTQPLSEDGFISESQKIELYEEIVNKMDSNNNIIIKKHPREITQYNFQNVIEIDGSFPSEIFTLLDIEFEKAIGICTSAVNSIKAKEAYNIDEKFLEKK